MSQHALFHVEVNSESLMAITPRRSLASALLEYLELSRFTDDFAYGPLRGDVRRAFYGNRGR